MVEKSKPSLWQRFKSGMSDLIDNGKSYFFSSSPVPNNVEQCNKPTFTVVSVGLNVRNSPGKGNDKWKKPLSQGDTVTPTGKVDGTWMEVDTGRGTGWISSKKEFVKKS